MAIARLFAAYIAKEIEMKSITQDCSPLAGNQIESCVKEPLLTFAWLIFLPEEECPTRFSGFCDPDYAIRARFIDFRDIASFLSEVQESLEGGGKKRETGSNYGVLPSV